MLTAQEFYQVFEMATKAYHVADDVDAAVENPFNEGTIEHTLFEKNMIDAVQWHLEDIIRNPEIDPAEALAIKRRIDASNQRRTDRVEELDDWFLAQFKDVTPAAGAGINTETPAWALDRLSILALKIYHMEQEVARKDASAEHLARCARKLEVLRAQFGDLTTSIDRLLDDLSTGRKYMRTYKQMKMYNDPDTNPVLYGKK